MPYMRSSSSSSSSDTDDHHVYRKQVILDSEYPALIFEGHDERPLSEQLEPIAVVGMGCRLPGDIRSPSQFWEMLINKQTGQTPRVPSSRFNIDAYFHSNNGRPGSFNVLGGYFLTEGLEEFDHTFFGISPIEANWMDPQQRKLLEVVYETIESAGLTLQGIEGSNTAVFAGSFTSDFQQMSMKETDFRHSYAATGVDPGIISNRISHVFNLNGPSITVNTACSSSIYAMHNACNALRNRECSAAIVGGTNLVLTVDQHMNTAKLGILSPTSTCHTFDESCDGYGRADAVGAVYLKRLADAVRDGDPIRGVLRSSAVNSNGKAAAVGITHPSLDGQANVIRQAYRRGGNLNPLLTGYFECHGTGTPVGDPLEVHAVANAMNTTRTPEDVPLLIGAVKTNIGHSEAASGLSAVIKAVLAVEKGIIPPTRGVVKPNPAIDWKGWKVQVVNTPTPFPAHLPVRRVSVNSFGYGGTNGHVIVESADSLLQSRPTYRVSRQKASTLQTSYISKRPFLLPFSAQDKATLRRNIIAHGEVAHNYNLLDLSYTLSNRRSRLPCRGYVVTSHETLRPSFANNLEAFSFAEKQKHAEIGFLFTGQGAQWARMGIELIIYYPSFLRSIKSMDNTLRSLPDGPDWTIEESLLQHAEVSRVDEAEISQPLCTAIQVALVQLLHTWGITPTVTVGHSSGEISAAFASGLISADEAITVAFYRGKVVNTINKSGSMMAVGLSVEDIGPYLHDMSGRVIIACHNSPSLITLSGDSEAMSIVKERLDVAKVFARSLKTGGKAYHSHHMNAAALPYEELISRARARPGQDGRKSTGAKMISTVKNSILSDGVVLDGSYWSANLCSPVLFNEAIQTLATSTDFARVQILIEIGPHSALSSPFKDIRSAFGYQKLRYIPSLLRGQDSATQVLKVAGELFLSDYPLDMERITEIEENLFSGKIHFSKGALLVDLPPYQWNHSKGLLAEGRHSREYRSRSHAHHDILGVRLPGASLAEPTWRNVLRIRDIPWLQHHSLGGEAVFPAGGYFCLAMEAILQLNELSAKPIRAESFAIRDIVIKKALVTPDNDYGIEVLTNLKPSIYSEKSPKSQWWDFSVSSVAEDGTQNDHIVGTISLNAYSRGKTPKEFPSFPQLTSGKSWNQAFRNVGFDYGAVFQKIADIRSDGVSHDAACKVLVETESGIMDGESRYILHPSTIDACLQLVLISIYAGRLNNMPCGAVPIQVDEIVIWQPTSQQFEAPASCVSSTHTRGYRLFVSDSQLVAHDGEILMDISNIRITKYEAAVPQKSLEQLNSQPYGEMIWKYDINSLDSTSNACELDVEDLVQLALFKDSLIRVLETGSKYAETILSSSADANYTVTEPLDESVESLSHITKSFKNSKAQKLDITQDLAGQGIPEKSFDLVIAPIEMPEIAALECIHSLLVPNGLLILQSKERPSIPLLHTAGFKGIKFIAPRKGKATTVMCRAVDSQGAPNLDKNFHRVQLVYRRKQTPMFSKVKKSLGDTPGCHVTICSLEECLLNIHEQVVLVADFEGALLATLTEKELNAIQNITKSAKSLLWVSCGGLLAGKKPEYAMAAGLARSVNSEQKAFNFTTLDFDLDNTSTFDVANIISSIACRQRENDDSLEREYYISEGATYISRLIPNTHLNTAYACDQDESTWAPFKPDSPIVGKVKSKKVIFEADDRIQRPLEVDEVEVLVIVSGLNKEDALVISGSDYATDFSHEIGGIVQRVGPGVNSFVTGDFVVGFSSDRLATLQRVPSQLLQKLLPNESLKELVSLPMAYVAALYGLKNLANLQPKEIVLILEGTGHAGVAAINIVNLIGAVPVVAVGTETEAERIKAKFGLPDKQVLLTSDPDMFSKLNKLTEQCGADVVFSSGFADASVAREAWRAIGMFGRFIDSGRKQGLARSALNTVPLRHGASYLSFDILDLCRSKRQTVSSLLGETVSLYRQKSISLLGPLTLKNITELDATVASFSDLLSAGKTLILHEQSDGLLNMLPTRPSVVFRQDASYLLVGCLGGLGRSLTSWMMRKGARRFVFLSRSGADSEQASNLVRDIQTAGCHVQVIRGDVTSNANVKQAVLSVPTDHPIRGVIHAAMVLKDGLFQSMSYDNWKISTQTKVQGAINLHNALCSEALDFFIMTSSISGILGTPGQSNYAAANSFLDSLSRHRRSQNQNSFSIVLPMVLGVGVVAENQELESSLKRKGLYGIEEDKLLECFEASLASHGIGSTADHLVAGLDPAQLQMSLSGDAAADVFWKDDVRFNHVLGQIDHAGRSDALGGSQSILSTITTAGSAGQAISAANDYIIEKLSRILLLGPDDFETESKAIADYGIDSMIGAEFRNWIFKEFATDIPFQKLLGSSFTIRKLSDLVCANQGISV